MGNILVRTKDLSYEEWLNIRKTGIGGSDAGAICGLNPYMSPMHVYQDKTSEGTEPYDNEAMRQGRDLEEYVAKRFVEETGFKVRRSNCIYQHEELPFMLANVDRLIAGENAGLECKTASAYSADKWKDGKIPEHYQIQCHHYMAVTGASEWYIAVVILGREFKYFKIDRDEELINDLIKVESDFWKNRVEKKILPEPDGSKITEEVINQYFPAHPGESIVLSGFNEKIQRRMELAELVGKLETEKRLLEQEIKMEMKHAQEAYCEQYHITWKEVLSVRLDTERIRKEKPEIYQEYGKPGTSRRFTVKAMAETIPAA